MFKGCYTALVTPFLDGHVDENAFTNLIERQIEDRIDGLVANGTTGESATLDFAEQVRVIGLTVETARGRVRVLGGAGGNDTRKAVALAKEAKAIGCDGAMVVTPYYNKPNQEGLYRHFMTIADAVEIPLVLYNVPARTAVDLAPETVVRLAGHPNIVGLKDATNDLGRVTLHRRHIAKPFALLSGEDATAVGFNALGGDGLISVTANVAPAFTARMIQASLAGDYGAAQSLALALGDLSRALFAEPSPAPAKAALAILGLCREEVRLPLVGVSEPTRSRIAAALDHLAQIGRA